MLIDLIQLEFIMVLLVAAGIYLRRRSVITDEGRDCLSDLLTMLILPCNIFLSFEGNTDMSALKSSLLTVIISVLVMLCTAILGKVIYRHREERKAKVFRYGLVNSNALFIGLPIIQSLLGDAGVLQLSMYMIFVRMFCWSYGLSLYTGVKSDWKGSFKRLLTHPCMIAAALGVAAMVSGSRRFWTVRCNTSAAASWRCPCCSSAWCCRRSSSKRCFAAMCGDLPRCGWA